jgi:hypothetical protein
MMDKMMKNHQNCRKKIWNHDNQTPNLGVFPQMILSQAWAEDTSKHVRDGGSTIVVHAAALGQIDITVEYIYI